MKFNKLIRKISFILPVFFFMTSCSSVEKTQEAINNEVVATYDNVKVTRGEVESYFVGFHDALVERYGEDYKNNKEYLDNQLKIFAENYAQNKILIEEFDKRALATDEEINKEVENMANEVLHLFVDEENGTLDDGDGHKINEEKLKEELNNAYYVDMNDYKEKQKDILKIDKLIQDVVKDINVTEEEIKAYYEENKEDKFSTGPGAQMYHILVNTEEEALKVKERLNNGEDYAAIAAELNPDSTSQTGGSLGFVEYENPNYDQDFLAGAKNLKEGEISDPVKTQFGYHIIKVTDVRNEPQYDDFESVKTNIEETLLVEKKQNAVTEFSENLFKEKNLKLK